MTKLEAQNRWWYRLIKLIYVSAVILSLVIPIAVFINNIPKLNPYESRFSIKCDDGRIRGDFDGSKLNSLDNYRSWDDSYFSRDDYVIGHKLSRAACYYKETGEELDKIVKVKDFFIPEEKNYTIIVVKPIYYNSWWTNFGYTFLAIFIPFILFSLIRAIFLYVLFGELFFKTFLEPQVYLVRVAKKLLHR